VVPPGKASSLRYAKTLRLERIAEGDCRDPDVLRDVGIMQATGVLLLSDSDLLNVEAALRIREIRKDIRIVSRIFQRHLARSLDDAIPNHYSLSDAVLAAPAFALAAIRSSYAGYFYLEDESQSSEPLQLWEVAELVIDEKHPLLGKTPRAIEREHATLVVTRRAGTGVAESTDRDPLFPPHDTSTPLSVGERVMVLARPDRAKGILQGPMPGRAAGFRRRRRSRACLESNLPPQAPGWYRKLLDSIAHTSPLTKLVFGVLVTLLLVGVSVFAAAGVHGVDPFFFTIVVLTGGYGDLQILQQEDTAVWVKLIASMLTMLGAALVGLVYGVMTEKVLLHQLGTLLLDRRIPRSGHVIVCGLGNIGVRVVEELHRMSVPVVAIEKKADNPFIDSVRRLGVPVIVANAAAAGVLRRARVQHAHCLVGATDDDLANLDVALAARAQCEQIRVVLRMFDHAMVGPLQKMFSIDVTYSVWMLVAPAFAAAALVGRTFGAFRWKDRSVLVQELVVPPTSPLVGKPFETMCAEFDVRGFVRGRVLDGGAGLASEGPIQPASRIAFLGTSDAMRRIADVARLCDSEESHDPEPAPSDRPGRSGSDKPPI
jgi:Trk K+ transport system NAD-binding subunit